MNQYKNKLGIIGTVGVPARYGGFETLAHQLVLNLNQEFDITVYNSTHHYSAEERVEEWEGAKIKYIPLSANGISSIFYDLWSMIHAIIYCDVLLILGVSACFFLPFIKLFFPSKKLIVNVDGLEWRRPKWNSMAKAFLRFNEKIAALYADQIVADNAAIQKYIYDQYNCNANLIEYGADHNQFTELSEKSLSQFPFLQEAYAFKVARIEPENNIEMILKAFAQQKELALVLVGNWQNSEYGQALYNNYRDEQQIHLLDPIYDRQLLNELRSNAKLYIHGHSAGGTNPSLVEAMYLRLPVFAYDIVYNKITTEHKACFFGSETALAEMIQNLDAYNLLALANELSEVADRRYCWNIIAHKYGKLAQGIAREPQPIFDFELPLALRQAMN